MQNSQTIQKVATKTATLEQPLRFYGYHVTTWKNRTTLRRVLFAGIVMENKLCVSIAECGNSDNFDKVKGRQIADERLKAKNFIITADLKEPEYSNKHLIRNFISVCNKALKPKGILDKLQTEKAKAAEIKEAEFKLKKIKKS